MSDSPDEQTRAHESAQQDKESRDAAREEMRELEQADELPDRIEDWPGGKAKYETFGGAEAESGYDEGATSKLGPSDLRHHEDGSVTIGGEKVDDPEEYKGSPIPGGPTDPNAPEDVGVTQTSIERSKEGDGDRHRDADEGSAGERKGDRESG